MKYPKTVSGALAVLAPLALLLLGACSLKANVLYVSTEGQDSSSCTAENPCRTITRAASLAQPGYTVRVAPGLYEERVTITKGGSQQGGYITFEGHNGEGCPGVTVEDVNSRGARPTPQVSMQGFVVDANYIKIDCFEITNVRAYGVDIRANRSYITVTETFVHDGASAGVNMPRIDVAKMPKHVRITNNYVTRTAYGFLIFCGDDCLIENNEVNSNSNPGAGDHGDGGDMDYIRFFGEGATFRNNYLHGNRTSDCAGCHIDCFQTFSAANATWQVARDMVFDGNVCMNAHAGFMVDGGQETSPFTTHNNWKIQNNIFRYGPEGSRMAWCSLFRHIGDVVFAHNLCASGNVGYRTGTTAQHINNIHYNVGVKPYWKEDSSVMKSSGNLLYSNINAAAYNGFVGDLLNLPPLFMDPDHEDFRPLRGSPSIDKGVSSPVTTDRLGNPRTIGSAPDVGPYEYKEPTQSEVREEAIAAARRERARQQHQASQQQQRPVDRTPAEVANPGQQQQRVPINGYKPIPNVLRRQK